MRLLLQWDGPPWVQAERTAQGQGTDCSHAPHHTHQVVSKEKMSSPTVETTGFPLVSNSLNPSLGEVGKRGDGN